jgi:hypothetical protein
MEIPFILTIVFTFLSPFVNAYITRVTWSSETKNLVAIAVSALIAVGYLLMTGGIADWSQLGVVIPAVYGLQQAIYQFILKVPATKFEAATRTGAVIVSPAETPGKVNITSDATIKDGTNADQEVSPPVQITPAPTEITSDTPAKG